MLELSMIAFDGMEVPTVGLKHLNDLLYFVTFHYWFLLSFDNTKVEKNLLISGCFGRKISTFYGFFIKYRGEYKK